MKTPSKSILVKFAKAKKNGSYQDFYTLATTDKIGGFTAKIVDELPQTGDPSIIYLILKEESEEGNIYDEWMWVLGPDNIYAWEHIGATNEVTLEVDDTMSDESENPVQNKVIKTYVDDSVSGKQDTLTAGDGIDIIDDTIKATNTGKARVLTTDDYNYPTDNPTRVALWLLEPGLYHWGSDISVYGSVSYNYTGTPGTALVMRGQSSDSVATILTINASNNRAIYSVNLVNGVPAGTVGGILVTGDIKDNLNSTASNQALSANQGKVLNDKIGGDLSNLTTTDKTSIINAINELVAQIGNIATTLHILNNGGES